MKDQNNNTSLIKQESGAIKRVSKTLGITKKLLEKANKPARITYTSVKIGTQEWMVENLNVDHFRNGEIIPEAKSDEEWKVSFKSKKPAWCFYDNNPENGKKYGKLYNWYALHDTRNIAPTGWHVATDTEWTILTTYLGGNSVAGSKLKEQGSTNWKTPNTGATNESGFTALPGGYRKADGPFYCLGHLSYWWSSTENYTTEYHHYDAITWKLDSEHIWVDEEEDRDIPDYGLYIRCIADF